MKKINVKGVIIPSDYQRVYDWLGWEATSPKKVNNEIENANNDDLEVEINSGGGDVFSGSEIYTALKSYQGNVTVKIVGIAASAASVIAMAGDKVAMSPTAQMMIHNVSTRTSGDYRDMEHSSQVLKNANETIANSYMLKSGMSKEELLGMMDKETWLTPQQALDHKLIDEIMFNEVSLVNSYGANQLLSRETIEKISNLINPSSPQKDETDILCNKKHRHN